ncbi:MAG: hypothetical protein JSW41_04890 [Candidatus Aenigmatarchaeota archaeon]|nr:MAG: hypothetical protein JSW41_04890 [Candidatus Aenigmarchaeota archaeon]
MSKEDKQIALIVSALQGTAKIFRATLLFIIEVATKLLITLGIAGLVILTFLAVWYTGEVTGLWDFVELEYYKNTFI